MPALIKKYDPFVDPFADILEKLKLISGNGDSIVWELECACKARDQVRTYHWLGRLAFRVGELVSEHLTDRAYLEIAKKGPPA